MTSKPVINGSAGCSKVYVIFVRGTATLALAAALVLTLGCASASPQGQVVVHGATSGSHLELSMRGGNLVVHGWMGPKAGAGCRLAHHRNLAVCRLAGAGGIEVDMGPSGDFVEVTERLPVPLTVHLGDGSDKFIGNGEPDTCYSEGARRNRCIGGGGDDICITGRPEQRLRRRRRGRLLPDRRRQRRLLGRPGRRRLPDGTRPGRLPRRRRARRTLRWPQRRPALRRRRLRRLRRPARLGTLARMRDRPRALTGPVSAGEFLARVDFAVCRSS